MADETEGKMMQAVRNAERKLGAKHAIDWSETLTGVAVGLAAGAGLMWLARRPEREALARTSARAKQLQDELTAAQAAAEAARRATADAAAAAANAAANATADAVTNTGGGAGAGDGAGANAVADSEVAASGLPVVAGTASPATLYGRADQQERLAAHPGMIGAQIVRESGVNARCGLAMWASGSSRRDEVFTQIRGSSGGPYDWVNFVYDVARAPLGTVVYERDALAANFVKEVAKSGIGTKQAAAIVLDWVVAGYVTQCALSYYGMNVTKDVLLNVVNGIGLQGVLTASRDRIRDAAMGRARQINVPSVAVPTSKLGVLRR